MKQLNHFIRTILIIFAFGALGMYPTSCIERPSTQEQRDLPDISEIEVGSGMDVFITFGQTPQIRVEGSRSTLRKIKTEVSGSKLMVYYKGNFGWGKKSNVFIQIPGVEKISASGGSDVRGENKLSGEYLEVQASGGSDIRLEVEVNSILAKVSGGADIVLSGSANYIEANTSGGGDLKALNLTVQSAKLWASGGSDISIDVTESLEANASGGADIRYRGNPSQLDIHNSAGGEIKKIK